MFGVKTGSEQFYYCACFRNLVRFYSDLMPDSNWLIVQVSEPANVLQKRKAIKTQPGGLDQRRHVAARTKSCVLSVNAGVLCLYLRLCTHLVIHLVISCFNLNTYSNVSIVQVSELEIMLCEHNPIENCSRVTCALHLGRHDQKNMITVVN